MRPRVLFMSEGSGEDAIGSLIISRLSRVEAHAMAMNTLGQAYDGVAPLVGPLRTFPSGGLLLDAFWPHLLADIRSGLVAHVLRQLAYLLR
ncbi:MAG: hypothetical protein AB1758_37765, partial [Candidatus Eremiobacterota bacterium]